MIKNRFVLIDAFALLFRAYYALPPGLTRDGQPIQAVYGFTSAILGAIKTLQPEFLAVGLDLPKPTKRHQEYVEYKAHRAPVPEDLSAQIPYAKEVLKAMNIPSYALEGYEGEDIIATIVAKIRSTKHEIRNNKKNNSDNFEFIIVTGDMDLLQLVDEKTKVYSMARGINQAMIYDEAKVKERYGLTPKQFVDFKALKGDASDNIPGVKGIGEKTACVLIQTYDNLENLYQELNSKHEARNPKQIQNSNDRNIKKEPNNKKISEKVIRLLLEQKEQAFLSRKLSKIQNDVPLEFKLADARVHDYNLKTVIDLFQKLGFKSLITRLPVCHNGLEQNKLF